MSLRRTPHRFAWRPQAEKQTGARVDGLQEGPAVTVPCQITPISTERAFEAFSVEVKRPHMMLCDTKYSGIKVGDKGTYDARSFEVTGVMVSKAGKRSDHVQVLLEEESVQ